MYMLVAANHPASGQRPAHTPRPLRREPRVVWTTSGIINGEAPPSLTSPPTREELERAEAASYDAQLRILHELAGIEPPPNRHHPHVTLASSQRTPSNHATAPPSPTRPPVSPPSPPVSPPRPPASLPR